MAEASIYVAEVLDRKGLAEVFPVTSGGLQDPFAASGNCVQLKRKNYPFAVGNRLQGSEREAASVVGPLGTALDVLARRM